MEGNKVFASHIHRAQGLFSFHIIDWAAIGICAVVGFLVGSFLPDLIAGLELATTVGFVILGVLGLLMHRRKDNHRFDHLELLLKARTPPVWSLCERDNSFKEFDHGRAS